MFKKLKFLFIALTMISSTSSLSMMSEGNDVISLYAEPTTESNVVGHIKPEKGIIPIYSKDNWVKVANPENGSVGWVESETLKRKGLFIHKTVVRSYGDNGGVAEESEKAITFTGFPKMSDEQLDEMMSNFEKSKKSLQENMNAFQKMMDQLMQQSTITLEALLKSLSDNQAEEAKVEVQSQ